LYVFVFQAKSIVKEVTMKKFFSELKIAVRVLKTEGFKALFKRYGWKLVAGVFVYYLVRDVTLYIIIPALVMRSLIN
jgi:hypothetical protein